MVTFLVSALCVGVLGGLIQRGRVGHLLEIRPVAAWLPLLALAAQVSQYAPWVHELLGAFGHSALIVASYAMAAAWLALNAGVNKRRGVRIGLAIAAIGWSLNGLVMMVNGGMPIEHTTRAERPTSSSGDVRNGQLFKHVPAEGSQLRWLDDRIAVPSTDGLFSPGDVFLWLGVALVISGGMTSLPDPSRPPPEVRGAQPTKRS